MASGVVINMREGIMEEEGRVRGMERGGNRMEGEGTRSDTIHLNNYGTHGHEKGKGLCFKGGW